MRSLAIISRKKVKNNNGLLYVKKIITTIKQILSAIGSITFPIFVISLIDLAIIPSSKSDKAISDIIIIGIKYVDLFRWSILYK